LTTSGKGADDDFNQRPFDFEAALAPAREVRVSFAHDTGAHQAWRGAGTPEDDLQVCVGLRDGKYRMNFELECRRKGACWFGWFYKKMTL